MTNSPQTSETPQSKRTRSMLIAAFGTIVEWYDFSIYFYVATILTREFFGDHRVHVVRDLPDALPVEMIRAVLDPRQELTMYEASASQGVGVFETLKAASRLVLEKLSQNR